MSLSFCLSNCSFLNAILTTNPYAPPEAERQLATSSLPTDVARRLKYPAIAMIALAIGNLGFDMYGIAEDLFFPRRSRLPTLGIPELAILGTLHALQALSGAQMRSLSSYRLAYIGALTCCIPCMSPFWLLGIPFGVWALRILSEPLSKAAFGRGPK